MKKAEMVQLSLQESLEHSCEQICLLKKQENKPELSDKKATNVVSVNKRIAKWKMIH